MLVLVFFFLLGTVSWRWLQFVLFLMLEIPYNSLGHLFSIKLVEQVLSLFCTDTFMAPIIALFECLPSIFLKTSCWDRKILLSLFCRWSAEIFGDLPTAKLEIRGRVKNKTCSPWSLPLLTDNTAFFFCNSCELQLYVYKMMLTFPHPLVYTFATACSCM